jgi:phytoene synthase
VLDLLREWRDPAGLAELAVGWEALLAEQLDPAVIAEFVAGRERAVAGLARELGVEAVQEAGDAARIWALADLAANVSEGLERELVVEQHRPRPAARLPASLRPLAVLAGLGARALRQGGAPLLDVPGSALLALRIGLFGR